MRCPIAPIVDSVLSNSVSPFYVGKIWSWYQKYTSIKKKKKKSWLQNVKLFYFWNLSPKLISWRSGGLFPFAFHSTSSACECPSFPAAHSLSVAALGVPVVLGPLPMPAAAVAPCPSGLLTPGTEPSTLPLLWHQDFLLASFSFFFFLPAFQKLLFRSKVS